MRQSQLFTKTKKETPKDEVSRNAALLMQAGFIHKEMAGVYDLLPLGLRVFKKIEQIVREEMDGIGGQEIEMTTLQNKAIWEQADKWDDEKVDVWFKTKLKNDTDLGLAFSHEEPIADMLSGSVQSYKDLPKYIYQFQTKFRNEVRAKSGIMRCREFVMKDMYSFNRTKEDLMMFYEQAKQAYVRIFERVGLGDSTYVTHADGSVFGDRSHEFQTLSEAGEDIIYVDKEKNIAINEEIMTDEKLEEFGLDKDNLVKEKSIEVGNIFPIEDKVAQALNFTYVDEQGEKQPVIMGSYGIGIGRLLGTIVEVHNDEHGIIWPEAVAPYQIHLVSLCSDESDVAAADKLYQDLLAAGVEVLYDDRADVRAGNKFADADLLGMPTRIVVSSKTLASNQVEVKQRAGGEVEMVGLDDIVASVSRT